MNAIIDDPARPVSAAAALVPGRLCNKIALVTGAAGNLGSIIVRRYLAEGATVVFTGRDRARTEAAMAAAVEAAGVPESQAFCVVMDAGKPEQVRAAVEEVLEKFGRIDIVVNNAGSAGPRQTVENLPLTAEELAQLREDGANDTETVGDATHNILGVAWNLIRVCAPHLKPGASVINVSSIFSRTEYFGRTAYVVPKAAMNTLTRRIAEELGERGIRVNNLLPGPIASERIRSVFATMDKLRGEPQGTMAKRSFAKMTLARSVGDAPMEKTFPTPDDIAATCVFLGSDDAAAYNGADFEVTHGMKVSAESRSTWMNRPTMRSVDATGHRILLAAGDQVDEALALARTLVDAAAEVVVGFATDTDAALAETKLKGLKMPGRVSVVHLNREDGAGMERLMRDGAGFSGAIIMPTHGAAHFAGPLSEASDAQVEHFVAGELCGIIAIVRALARCWKTLPAKSRDPRVVFLTNRAHPEGNMYAALLQAAVEQLIRIWRDESEVEKSLGRRNTVVWANQVVRTENSEAENLPFAAGHTARLLFKDQKIDEINLYVPRSIGDASGARRALVGETENLAGLHLGKTALITGSSAGIGGQVARLLALSGARVMLVARRAQELDKMRDRIAAELTDAGFPDPMKRVQILGGIDVGDPASLQRAVQATIEAFGRLDYLINNAGVSGAEEMVVDMKLADWRYTLEANLISNYTLTHAVLPAMKAQGSGYVLNVSSYFGGEKYLAVAYPNRADYAVSKAGQRAMVETMARFLGPEVQFNAIAPGPVDGDRLLGVGGRPGLFERRGKLILEKKRLNAVHAALVQAIRDGAAVADLLALIAKNDVAALQAEGVPAALKALAARCVKEGDEACHCGTHILTPVIAGRLLDRLRRAGYLADAPDYRTATDGWLARVPADPFFRAKDIGVEAEKVRGGVLGLLHLRKMPTESEVALATVYFLADRAVSGETFMPSGGLALERSVTERELFGAASPDRLAAMQGKTVWLIGEHLTEHLAEAARHYATQCNVGSIVAIMKSREGADRLAATLADLPAGLLHLHVCGEDVEAGMETALTVAGRPEAVVSTPFVPLPDALFQLPDGAALDPGAFRAVVEANLTHHFRVSRVASLFDGAQLVLVTPDVEEGHGAAAFALANFIKTTLHAFTLTLAVEDERLVHDVVVNQINLTRRVRSEEPRNAEERMEEVRRFARAVLLAGTPQSDLDASRYRARINRGMAITV